MKLKLPLLLLIICQWAFAQIEFIEVPSATEFLHLKDGASAFADVDGDGDLDLLTTGETSTGELAARLYINIGLGGKFVLSTDSSFVGLKNSDIAFGDLDNDGDQDVILLGNNSPGDPTTKVYGNDGTGVFVELTGSSIVHVSRGSVSLGDIDNDNDLDLFITGVDDEQEFTHVSKLYTNNGNGGFSEVQNTNFVGVSSSSTKLVDVDNDNDLDLIFSGLDYGADSQFELYKNDGQGNFAEVAMAFEEASSAFDVADLNGDGHQDILAIGSDHLLYINDGTGVFSQENTPFPTGNFPKLALGDIDNDGDTDVFLSVRPTGQSAPTTEVYLNDGQGAFTVSGHGSINNLFTDEAIFADLDEDNLPELFVMGSLGDDQTPQSILYANQGGSLLEEASGGMTFAEVSHGDVAFGDIDGDGDQDLVIGGTTGSSGALTKLYTNDGNGVFNEVENTPFGALRNGGNLALSDVDADGDLDLFVATDFNAPSLRLYVNNGQGHFTDSDVEFDFDEVSKLAVKDIDDNGFPDLFLSGSDFMNPKTILLKNTGMVSFNQEIPLPSSIALSDLNDLSLADIDGDLDYDLAITGINDSNELMTNLYINDGAGSFTQKAGTPFLNLSSGSVDLFDYDGDGDFDLLQTGFDNSLTEHTKLFENDGQGNFTEDTSSMFFNTSDAVVAFSDIEGDGHVDVFIAGFSTDEGATTSKLYTNDGSGNFSEITDTPFEGVEFGAIAFADIDGDGDEDVLITGEGTSTVPITKLYVNETPQVALSIENRQAISEDLIVYPNPTKTNKLFVEFTGHQTEIEWVIKIHDLFGRTVLKEQINNTTGQPIEIELPVLAVGQYFISIANGKQKATKGFVVE